MEPPAVTATATVMIALTPGAKPRPVVVDARRAAELARAFTDARIACLAGQEALDGIAAHDALAAQQDLAAAEAAADDDISDTGDDPTDSIIGDEDEDAAQFIQRYHVHPESPASVYLPDAGSCPPGETATGHIGHVAGDAAADGPVITAPADPGWRDPATGLMSGRTYDHLSRLSCGCTFAGPLTWPAGRRAHCDSHGDVETVPGPDDPEHRPLLAVAPETGDAR